MSEAKNDESAATKGSGIQPVVMWLRFLIVTVLFFIPGFILVCGKHFGRWCDKAFDKYCVLKHSIAPMPSLTPEQKARMDRKVDRLHQ